MKGNNVSDPNLPLYPSKNEGLRLTGTAGDKTHAGNMQGAQMSMSGDVWKVQVNQST